MMRATQLQQPTSSDQHNRESRSPRGCAAEKLARHERMADPLDGRVGGTVSGVRPRASIMLHMAVIGGLFQCVGCATIIGTAVSPLTGSVDLCWIAVENNQWYLAPF